MGYTHYWRRPKEIDPEKFRLIVSDFSRLLPKLAEMGVPLAGGDGEGEPVIDEEEVWFNGSKNCGHPVDHSVVIPWPMPGAGGVAVNTEVAKGTWFAGTTLEARCCDGDCSYETFWFPRVHRPRDWEKPDREGRYFDFCKTAFRPYDLAVTAFLVIAKHHLGDRLVVASDGDEAHWFDAKLLCQMELGYGLGFRLDEE